MKKFHTLLFPRGNRLVPSAVSNSMSVDLTIYKFSFSKMDSLYYLGLWME